MKLLFLKLGSDISSKIWYKMYADDLVFICSDENLEILIKTLESLSIEFALKINKKKSALMPIKLHKARKDLKEVFGYPIV